MIERWTRCAAYSLSCNRRVVLQRKFQATWNEGWWLRLLISNLIHLRKCHRCCQKMRPLPCIPDRIDRCSEIKNDTFINCTLHMSPCVNANVLQHMAYEIIMSIQWPFEATCQPFSQRVAGGRICTILIACMTTDALPLLHPKLPKAKESTSVITKAVVCAKAVSWHVLKDTKSACSALFSCTIILLKHLCNQLWAIMVRI